MAKVTIESDGEKICELQGESAFGGVITNEEDSSDVAAFLVCDHTCEQNAPEVMADTMCRLVKKTSGSEDASEQMEALITFASAVDEITKREMAENREACEEMFRRMLREAMEV